MKMTNFHQTEYTKCSKKWMAISIYKDSSLVGFVEFELKQGGEHLVDNIKSCLLSYCDI